MEERNETETEAEVEAGILGTEEIEDVIEAKAGPETGSVAVHHTVQCLVTGMIQETEEAEEGIEKKRVEAEADLETIEPALHLALILTYQPNHTCFDTLNMFCFQAKQTITVNNNDRNLLSDVNAK